MRHPHTAAPRGKRIRVVLKDGTSFVAKFLERTAGKFVVFDTCTVKAGTIKSFTICRGPQ